MVVLRSNRVHARARVRACACACACACVRVRGGGVRRMALGHANTEGRDACSTERSGHTQHSCMRTCTGSAVATHRQHSCMRTTRAVAHARAVQPHACAPVAQAAHAAPAASRMPMHQQHKQLTQHAQPSVCAWRSAPCREVGVLDCWCVSAQGHATLWRGRCAHCACPWICKGPHGCPRQGWECPAHHAASFLAAVSPCFTKATCQKASFQGQI